MKIPIKQTLDRRPRPDESDLGFGKHFADHMFLMEYSPERGWHDARIEPYHSFQIEPANLTLHYGQTIFEGMKAFRWRDNTINLFRAKEHLARFARSAELLCMPSPDQGELLEHLKALLDVDRDWVPSAPGTALYLRPVLMAADDMLGVRPSKNYRIFIITSPVGSYYKGGMKPTRIYVEEEAARVVKGGLGEAKTAANYAASLRVAESAKAQGFDQVLWLDAIEHQYVEEVGTMNIFFLIDNVLVTPPLDGTILHGVTRRSVIDLATGWGIPVEERLISMNELASAHKAGKLQEVFGSGTAAVISPVGELFYRGESMLINEGPDSVRKRLFDAITGVQYGELPDIYGWMTSIDDVKKNGNGVKNGNGIPTIITDAPGVHKPA